MKAVRRSGRWMVLARFTVSVALLLVLVRAVDVGEVLARLARLDGRWAALGLALSVPQVALLAWRWRFTAARLGLDLPFGAAVGEYYLAIFLNQTLPGAVLGDVSRAWRHARTEAETGAAVRAVVFERVSAQVVMTGVAILSVTALPFGDLSARLAAAVTLLALLATAVWWSLRRPPPGSLRDRIRADGARALLAPEAFPHQLWSGVVVVASYIGIYLVAARAVGVETELVRLAPLVAPVLMTMLIPVTIAGWGVREGAAAALWASVGATAEEGVAISVAYGVLVLLSSLPGGVMLLRTALEGRGRRGDRPRAGSVGSSDGAHPGGRPPDRG